MKILFTILLLTAPFYCFSHGDEEPKHLADLRVLEENILPANNSYTHRHIIVTWKGIDGARNYASHTYCSGLLEALLSHSYGYSREDFIRWFHKEHPRSENFYDAIKYGTGFIKITNVHDIVPGDIIALKFPKGEYFERGDSSGHVMIVDKFPQLWTASPPLVEFTRQWVVAVIDSSKTGHGKGDSRYIKRGKYEPGLGKGLFRIYTDESDRIVGYAWSTSKRSDYYPQKTRSLVVGRLIPNYIP
jgi:hypothetical protein